VLLETAGTHDISRVDPRVHIVMDLKTPGSGQEHSMLWDNLKHLKADRDEVKFVLCDRRDFDWAIDTISKRRLADLARAVLLSPAFGKLEPRTLAEWILETPLPSSVRFQTQLHRHIWPHQQRGV
jgi:7-carboxy-7-deazaguanine synthase